MLSCLNVVVRGVDASGFVVILLLYSYVSSFNAVCCCFVVMVRLHCVLRRISLPCRASWMVCMVYFGLPSAVDACSWRLAWPKQEQNMVSVNLLAALKLSLGLLEEPRCPKMSPRGRKLSPRGSKMSPRGPKMAPIRPQEGSKMA